MLGFVNWKVRCELTDTRAIVGILMAFDKHMNIVMGDCEEIRLRVTPKTRNTPAKIVEERRILGMILLRGNQVISMKPEAPPSMKPKLPASAIAAATAGPLTMQGARPMMPGPLMVGAPRPGMGPVVMMARPGMPGMPMLAPGMVPMGMPMMPGMMRPGVPLGPPLGAPLAPNAAPGAPPQPPADKPPV